MIAVQVVERQEEAALLFGDVVSIQEVRSAELRMPEPGVDERQRVALSRSLHS